MPILEAVTTANRITGVAMGLLGLVSLWVAHRFRNQHPPLWVLGYRGRGSFRLAHIFLAVWCTGFFLSSVLDVLPRPLVGLLAVLWVLSFVAWLVGYLVWFPLALTPGWYRRAKAAGVNIRDPGAVEAFRSLPLERQTELASA